MSSSKRTNIADRSPINRDRMEKLIPVDGGQKPAILDESQEREPGQTDEITEDTDPLHQTSFMLPLSSIDWLDEQTMKAKRGKWRGVHKASIIRALVEIAKESGADLSGVANLDMLKLRLIEAIKSHPIES